MNRFAVEAQKARKNLFLKMFDPIIMKLPHKLTQYVLIFILQSTKDTHNYNPPSEGYFQRKQVFDTIPCEKDFVLRVMFEKTEISHFREV